VYVPVAVYIMQIFLKPCLRELGHREELTVETPSASLDCLAASAQTPF